MKLPPYPWRFVHLAALWGYGVSQPVFSMLKGNPEFLIINGTSRTEAVVFALVLAFGPPVIAIGLELAVGLLSSNATGLVHLLFLWLFGFTAALQVLERLDPTSKAAILLPAVAAYGVAIAYTRWRAVRTFLSVSFVLPVLGLVLFVSTAPLALANTPAAHVRIPAQTPVVLVVFDEFPVSSLMRPDGAIDAVRYPGFGRLARDGTWYSHAASVADDTTQAVPAILTGDAPRKGALPTLADHPDNLFTLLGERYALRVKESVTRLCPTRYCPDHESGEPLPSRVSGLLHDVGINYLQASLPAAFRGDVSALREGWGALVDDTGPGGGEFLASVKRSDPAQTLYFLHIIQPHVPWERLPSGHRYGDPSVIEGITDDWQPGSYERWRDQEPWLVAQALQRHLLQVGYVDGFVQRLLRRLDKAGLYDRALVVLTADHGVSFRPGGWRRHAMPQNVSDIAAVPLFVKYPGQTRGHEDRRDVQTIDIVPTIADVLGIHLPWPVDGQSLRAGPVERSVRIGRRDEPAVVARPGAVAAAAVATAGRNAAWFGTGAESLYHFGPRRDLLGRPIASFPRAAAAGADVLIPRAAELGAVDMSSGYVPVHVLGRIHWDGLRPREDIAVAVNGRVAAVSRPFVSTGDTWFAAMIDEDLLHGGSNSLDVFAVRGAGAATHLLRLGGIDKTSFASVAAG